jgi:hypothetical protein
MDRKVAEAEKEEFLVALGDLLRKVSKEEELVVCGDLNCHVGLSADGYEVVHGGRGYGMRNTEGEAFLEVALALDMAVVNTWFVKPESQRISFESGGNRTTVDYVLVRRADLSKVQDMKVIPGECCLLQHRLLVCVLKLEASVKRKRKVVVSKRRVWKLKDAAVKLKFRTEFSEKMAGKAVSDVDGSWSELKGCLLEIADDVCGSTKGLSRHKETWWWSDDVSRVVVIKRKAYLEWKRTDSVVDKERYQSAKKDARRIIAAAQECRRKQFAEDLVTAHGKGKLFRVVKQMVRKNADVVGGGCVRDKGGKIVTDEEEVKCVWGEYFKNLLNEEFDWNRKGWRLLMLSVGCVNRLQLLK